MKCYSLSHLSDESLLRGLIDLVARDRVTTAEMLAHIAEVDERKLYLPAGYPSMFAYCVGELGLSEDAAARRIQGARIARRFPAIFEALARGRLHLTAVGLLAPHLVEHTASELLSAAEHKTKAEIERLLAERFPKSDLLTWVAPMPASDPAPARDEHALAHVDDPQVVAKSEATPAQLAPERVETRARVSPLSARSYALQATIDSETQDYLRRAQHLLGAQVPSGDVAQVLKLALKEFVIRREKRKFAATNRPRPARPGASRDPRTIPARVRRAVRERDGGQCTFVGENGRRCTERKGLEFDHVLEVARGGEATVDGIRLLCRAHNQHAAERTFGAEFMRHKRAAAAESRAEAGAARARTRELRLSSPG
jgi:5-methylcytosine-specific restriction endonuclease McrA